MGPDGMNAGAPIGEARVHAGSDGENRTAGTGPVGRGEPDSESVGESAATGAARPAPKRRIEMTLMRRPSPLTDVVTVRDAVDRLFDERFLRPIWQWDGEREAVPALDLFTTQEAVIAKVALPGVKPEDVDVTIADDLVTVHGSYEAQKETTEAGYLHKELSRGSFSRSFALPTAVKADAATASFKDGLLTLTLPKTEEVKPKHVKVEVSH
jgi:HSP20 family protein